MTKNGLFIAGGLLALGLLIATAVFMVVTYEGLQSTQGTLSDTQFILGSTQKKLVHQIYVASVSQKSSTQTRVSTVSQRCHLTMLLVGFAIRTHDPISAKAFSRSYAKCEIQLTSVRAIDAATPFPPKNPDKKK